jgi:1,4-dihydroxy-2-naphthoyl-CoA hydrolase
MRSAMHTTISLGDTDAAGVLFYARLFELTQRAFEHHCAGCGFPIARFFADRILAPVVHVEADYRRALRLGDAITVEASVESIGDSSFRMGYVVRTEDGGLAAEALVVHVCIGADGRSAPVPALLRAALAPHG